MLEARLGTVSIHEGSSADWRRRGEGEGRGELMEDCRGRKEGEERGSRRREMKMVKERGLER